MGIAARERFHCLRLSSPERVIEKNRLHKKRARETPSLLIHNALMANFRWGVPTAALHVLSDTLCHHVRFRFGGLAGAEIVRLFLYSFFICEGFVLVRVFEPSHGNARSPQNSAALLVSLERAASRDRSCPAKQRLNNFFYHKF